MADQKRLLLDVDTGIDDALAILYALQSREARVEGIITGAGQVSLEQATYNTLQVVEAGQAGYEIPVVKGASKPLIRKEIEYGQNYDANGLGNANLPVPKLTALAMSASDFILLKAKECENELIIITMGRLTNLANAVAKDPSLGKKVKKVIIAGGAIREAGNVTAAAECNFWGDPEAALFVLEAGLPITLVSLDITQPTMFTSSHLAELLNKKTEQTESMLSFIKEMALFQFGQCEDSEQNKHSFAMQGPLAVGIALDSTLIRTKETFVQVECKGEVSRGALIADLRQTASVGQKVLTGVEVDSERFIQHWIATLTMDASGGINR
ncbi:nucleoside hydrolase [Brevibacillus laterosporus]|uniref:nucleoside hydrolase n=1 Tax=Brevibacillus laterosporus TaxID=1465 RepID=UPI0018CD2FF3|nr:nucleoside hydrolase [Brevibacillus laterosporus]MBG9798393.1 ribonucleoside hydrolase [Brevibacillus laterosporus]MED1912853.1 nucleoside hydrolase [Brevibacillus laterosporus]